MKNNISAILGRISFFITLLLIILMVNVFLKIFTFINLSAIPLIMPIYICPICIILSAISLIKNKNKIAIISILLNAVLLILQITFIIIGAKLTLH